MPINKKVNRDFFKKWNREMSYILGFFTADGSMNINKRGAHFWNIQINDKDLLFKIRDTIKSNHTISVRPKKINQNTSYRLQIGSKEMFNDLYDLGIRPNKTKSLSIPKIPNKYLSDFVRGYFDGDGNVWVGFVHKDRKNPLSVVRTVFTSCSKNFLLKLALILEEAGIGHGVLSVTKGNYYRLSYSVNGSLKLYSFMYNGLRSSSLFLERKKRVFDRFIKMRV